MRCETQEEHAGDESVLVLVSAAAASPKLDARVRAPAWPTGKRSTYRPKKVGQWQERTGMRPKSGNPSPPVFSRLTLVMKWIFDRLLKIVVAVFFIDLLYFLMSTTEFLVGSLLQF